MRIFLTGATGFVGSAIVPELIQAGHQVLGLTRSDAGAKALLEAGAEVHRGDLKDLDSIRAGAEGVDAVIHTAFNHDFSNYAANCELDRRVIEAIGSALANSESANSDRRLIVTSGTGIIHTPAGVLAKETDEIESGPTAIPRVASEEAAAKVAALGVRVSTMRLPQVHDPNKQGLVTYAIAVAQQKGVSAYIGDGANRWPAVHIRDCARAYKLAIEKGESGRNYHPVGEEGVSMREIAEAIGRRIKAPVKSISPEEAADHFGWMGMFIGRDLPASSALTQEWLGWRPTTGIGLIADIDSVG
jgi:nucleoside-diphosphate-sugar epimerase